MIWFHDEVVVYVCIYIYMHCRNTKIYGGIGWESKSTRNAHTYLQRRRWCSFRCASGTYIRTVSCRMFTKPASDRPVDLHEQSEK